MAPGTALSRAALERVLARAAELQGTTGEADESGAMTEAQIIELGKEVGLSPAVLRRAIAEERSRTILPEQTGRTSTVSAARTVPGNAAAVLGVLDAWMQRAEGLQVKRRFADQVVWEARHDFFSTLKRALTSSGRGLELAGADEVTAIVADVAPGQSHVRIVANFTAARNLRVVRSVPLVLLLVGVITGPLLAIGIAPLNAAIPAVLIPGAIVIAMFSRFRQLVARAQITLEQALDRLEFADTKPPSTAQVLLDAFMGAPRPPGK
jgi:hypothetical protein